MSELKRRNAAECGEERWAGWVAATASCPELVAVRPGAALSILILEFSLPQVQWQPPGLLIPRFLWLISRSLSSEWPCFFFASWQQLLAIYIVPLASHSFRCLLSRSTRTIVRKTNEYKFARGQLEMPLSLSFPMTHLYHSQPPGIIMICACVSSFQDSLVSSALRGFYLLST